MNATEIQEVRAMLAAQTTATEERRPPTLARTLSRLLAPSVSFGAPSPSPVVLAGIDEPPAPDEAPLLLAEEITLSAPIEAVPPELLLGALSPRRAAFGQRSETVLELSEPVAVEPQRLVLVGTDGAPVGEIILHAVETPVIPPRRPFAAEVMETPFFPEDLADEPSSVTRASKLRRRAVRTGGVISELNPTELKRPELRRVEPDRPELAATFLLADLAARLASEDEALRQRLAAA